MDCSTPGLPVPHNLWNLPKFMFMALVMPSSHLILWRPLLLLPSIFPRIRTFSMSRLVATGDQNTGASASASVLPVNIQGWSPLRVTGLTFSSLLQHHSLKASILWYSAFFMVQLSQPNVTNGKTTALTIQTFVDSVNVCFSTHCLGLSLFSCQEAVIFWFRGCTHHLPWFWTHHLSPRRGNLSPLPPFPLLFAMQ